MSVAASPPSRLRTWISGLVREVAPFFDHVVLPVGSVLLAAYVLVPRIEALAHELWFPASDVELLTFATVVIAVTTFYLMQHVARFREWPRMRVLGLAVASGLFGVVLLFGYQALKYNLLVPVNASWLEQLGLREPALEADAQAPVRWVLRPFVLPDGLREEMELKQPEDGAEYRLVDYVSTHAEEYVDLVFAETPNQMLAVSALFYLCYLGVVLAFTVSIALGKEVPGSELRDFVVGLADLIDGRGAKQPEPEHTLERPAPLPAHARPAASPARVETSVP